MSILRRTSLALLLAVLAAAVAGCTEDQSKKIGSIPKSTVDRATTDVNKSLQQGADRSREAEEKK